MESQLPIRVVVFTAGPTIRRGIQRFIRDLETHPEIELSAVVCESQGFGLSGTVRDAIRRRGILAAPVLLLRGVSTAFSVVREPRETWWNRQCLKKLGDRLVVTPDIHSPETIARIRATSPRLGLVYGAPILKPSVFELPGLGTLGIHHGTLPNYRGKKTTFWALFNDERTAGVTIQRINAGLDTGEIVRYGQVPADGRSLRAVWESLENLGRQLYIEAILQVATGTASYRRPEGPKGKLYRDPKARDIFRFYVKRLKR